MHSAVVSNEFVSQSTLRAVTLAAGVTGIVWLIVGGVLLVDLLAARGLLEAAGIPLVCLAVQAGLYLLALTMPGRVTAIAFVTMGAVCVFAFQYLVLSVMPDAQQAGQMMLNRGGLALALLGAVTGSALGGVFWCLAGFAAGSAATIAAAIALGLPPILGAGPVMAAATFSVVLFALGKSVRLHDRRVQDLAALQAETARVSAGRAAEQRAAALIHDTVLGDLSVIAHTDGDLSEHERARLRADAAALRSAIETGGFPTGSGSSLQQDVHDVVRDFQWRGLSVDVSGDSDALTQLPDGERDDLLAAMRACLENVQQHAGTESADVFIDSDRAQVTVMVVDHGAGFEIESIAPDRLGVRNSIVGRLRRQGGSATIWSQPGIGTSVILSVPLADAEVGRES